MANRRSPRPKLTEDEIKTRRQEQRDACSLCCKPTEGEQMSAEHIIPLRSTVGFDVPSNVHFVCSRCVLLVKRTIRIPVGLADRATEVSKTSFAEVVRVSLQRYLESLAGGNQEHRDNEQLRQQISRLEQKVKIYSEQLKLIEEALEFNPFEKYIKIERDVQSQRGIDRELRG